MNDYLQPDLLDPNDLQIVKYGTFWPRFWALLIDALILAVLTPFTIHNRNEWKSVTLLIVITLLQLGYKSFFEYEYGATPGKMALKLKVVNYHFQKASLKEILLRNIFQLVLGAASLIIAINTFYNPAFFNATTMHEYTRIGNEKSNTLFFSIASIVIYLIDLIYLLNSEDSRSLHDRIGKTFVIKTT